MGSPCIASHHHLTTVAPGETLHKRRALGALGGTNSPMRCCRAVDPSRWYLNMSIRLFVGSTGAVPTLTNKRTRMRTQATDSGAAVSRPTLTAHLRPAGRLRTPVRPDSFHHDPTVRFLHRSLHLQAEPLPPATAPRGRARPARPAGRRLDNRRAGVLTLWTGLARLSPVRDDRPVRGWAGVLRTPLQQRQARELAKQSGWSPAGGKWGPCSIVNAATPRSVATDPRGRGFPAPYQTFLKERRTT